MKMRNVFLLGIIAIILISSCKKEEETPPPPPPIKSPDYTPLTIGNYWVYNNYSIDSLNNETLLPNIDSLIVDRDTVIGGHTYYIIEGIKYPMSQNWGIVRIVRDSADCLVTNKGHILFSSSNFSDILREKIEILNSDTLYILQYKMEKLSGSIDVPAGTFNNIYNYKGTLYTKVPNSVVDNPRYLDNYYAPDVGEVLNTWYFLSLPTTYQKRLVRYNIQ